jgi:probable F420-dependent oxidoreductase
VTSQPFRFGLLDMSPAEPGRWRELARRTEDLGFSTLVFSDHTDRSPVAPIPAMAAAAAVTSTLRVGTLVLDNDFRNPGLLAKELTTIDLISEGRLEVGLGAGWLTTDYTQTGLPYDPAPTRLDRLEEAVAVLRGAFAAAPVSFAGTHYRLDGLVTRPAPVQAGGPPILLGGGGPRVLGLAGRTADIVSVNWSIGSGRFDAAAVRTGSPEATDAKVALVRQAAGDRSPELHLNCYCVALTDDPDDAVASWIKAIGAPNLEVAEVRRSPHVLVGSREELVEQVLERRDRWGFSYLTCYAAASDVLAPVVAELAGR